LCLHSLEVDSRPRQRSQMPEPWSHLSLAFRQVGLRREPHPSLEPKPRGGDVQDLAGNEGKTSRTLCLCPDAGGYLKQAILDLTTRARVNPKETF
jgi:hypothetical protein